MHTCSSIFLQKCRVASDKLKLQKSEKYKSGRCRNIAFDLHWANSNFNNSKEKDRETSRYVQVTICLRNYDGNHGFIEANRWKGREMEREKNMSKMLKQILSNDNFKCKAVSMQSPNPSYNHAPPNAPSPFHYPTLTKLRRVFHYRT